MRMTAPRIQTREAGVDDQALLGEEAKMKKRKWIIRGLLAKCPHAAAIVLSGVLAILAGSGSSAAQSTGDAEIFGTLEFNGCTPPLHAVALQAAPVTVTSQAEAPKPSPAGVRPAAISSTSDPRVFDFRVRGLELGQVYVLRAGVRPGLCGKLILQAENSGTVVAGSGIPARLRGYALQSRFDVLGTPKLGRKTETWVPAEAVDLRDPAGAFRRIRFSSDLPGVIGFELQISINPFPKSERQISNSCQEPSIGLFSRQTFALVSPEGDQRVFPNEFETTIDFYNLVQGSVETLSETDQLMVERGAPLHVRAVPYTAAGFTCNTTEVGLNPEIVIASLPFPILDLQFDLGPPVEVGVFQYWPAVFDFKNFSEGTRICTKVIREHPLGTTYYDPFGGKYFYLDPFEQTYYQKYKKLTAEPGEGFCYNVASPSGDGSILEQAVSIISEEFSGIVDGVAWAVNSASKLWDDAKALAVKVMADAITETGLIDCNNDATKPVSCKQALEAALTYAMASMGVPPSLPNFDQLMNEGVDYVAARAASEAGIPEDLATEVADRAYELATKEIKKAGENRGDAGFPNWIVPDVGWQYARVRITLDRIYSGAATREAFSLASNNSNNDLFLDTQFDIPAKWPGHQPGTYVTQLGVPLTLTPDVSGIGIPMWVATDSSPFTLTLWYKEKWDERFFLTFCEHWIGLLADYLPDGKQELHLVLDTRLPSQTSFFTLDPFFQSCKTYGD